ncbi:uncharacterized protein TNCV_1997161 [Trichonephila clavipes]|uniref:Uncharacterized protein n=1 Tax=Trichonephila clavipes TaxID=2585209 RepID=A0A8X6RQI2_TRICX|nr:uncharacterized protein TNCV_1997161 [Trichonephila clavipes]
MLDVTKYPPSAHGFTCRNCGGGDRGRVAIYRPFGEVSLSLNRTVTCMVLKANDRRTSCPCHDEFRGPRSDYVRQRQNLKCDEEGVETWMACVAEDCGFQMLNDDVIVTSMYEESDPVDDEMDKTRTTTKIARVHQMLTRFLR